MGSQYAMFSGGRSSLTMVLSMLERGERIDGVVFNNTSLESPFTYRFLEAAESLLLKEFGAEIVFLEYIPKAPYFRVVPEFAQLKRDGSVFQSMIDKESFIPNSRKKLCTAKLKVDATANWIRTQTDIYNVQRCIGLRWGENVRIQKGLARNAAFDALEAIGYDGLDEDERKSYNRFYGYNRYPLQEWGIAQPQVMECMNSIKGRLGLDFDICDTSIPLSNCSGCFCKNPVEQERMFQDHPEARQFWISNESHPNHVRDSKHAQVRRKRNLTYRKAFAESYGRSLNENLTLGDGYWANFYPIAAVPELARVYTELSALPLFAESDLGCDSGECNID